MKTLLAGALAVVVGAALVEVAVFVLVQRNLPLWAAFAVPIAAGIITFMASGRRRALRRQRARRLRAAARAAAGGTAVGRELS